jgi:hypothetical protein
VRAAICFLLWAACFGGFGPGSVHAADARFTGEPSCRSAGCHGGGATKNQCLIWEKKDAHARAQAILSNARSQRIVETLKLGPAAQEGRCTICHSPLQSVAASRMMPGMKPEQGVSCETCHGAAEGWLRFHTRTDLTREQRLSAGMRDLHDSYHRANVCVACHLNVEPDLLKAGHPELNFELWAQMKNEPPHWPEEKDPWAAPRVWETGQAAALRELSWKASTTADEEVQARRAGLLWLLRQSALGKGQLPEGGDAAATQSAADRLAHAAQSESWNRESTLAQIRQLAETGETFRQPGVTAAELRRRAEPLMVGVDRLWQALKANGTVSPGFETALAIATGEAGRKGVFDPVRFAAALQQVEVALEQMKQGKPAGQ